MSPNKQGDYFPKRIHIPAPYIGTFTILADGTVPTSGCVYIKIGEWVKVCQENRELREKLQAIKDYAKSNGKAEIKIVERKKI